MAEREISEAGEDGQHSLRGSARSTPPWNAAAAAAVIDPRYGVRALERELRLAVLGHQGQHRGDSDRNTYKAIEAISVLGDQLERRDDAHDVARRLDKWSALTRRLPAVDDLLRWVPIRQQEGCLPPVCPWCGTYSLRVAAERGFVACWKPVCEDGDGNRPAGRLDYNRLTGQPAIYWNDGTVQGPG